MPRQHSLPHTAAPAGPCDAATTAYMDALEAASEANAAKKRCLQELLDAMLSNDVPRVAVVDPKTNRPKWLEITEGEPRLRSRKAEAGELVESPADRRRRAGRSAGGPETVRALPVERTDDDPATDGPQIEPVAAGELVEGAESSDLRTAGQQRRRGVR